MHGHGRTFFGEAPPSIRDSEDSFPEASLDAQRRVGYAMGRIAADQLLKPMVTALCTRLRHILSRLPSWQCRSSRLAAVALVRLALRRHLRSSLRTS